MFGNPSIRYDVMDAQIQLSHLRRLHSAVEKTMLEFPFKATDAMVSTITSEPWDEPVSDDARTSIFRSKEIEAKVMARFQRQSAISVAYAVFEFALLELAMNFRAELKLPRDIAGERSRGLKKAKALFLQSGHQLTIFNDALWEECLDIALVRNQVMHSGGLVPVIKVASFSRIKGLTLEAFSNDNLLLQICLDRDCIFRAFRVFDDLLAKAHSEVERIFYANP